MRYIDLKALVRKDRPFNNNVYEIYNINKQLERQYNSKLYSNERMYILLCLLGPLYRKNIIIDSIIPKKFPLMFSESSYYCVRINVNAQKEIIYFCIFDIVSEILYLIDHDNKERLVQKYQLACPDINILITKLEELRLSKLMLLNLMEVYI